MRIGIIGSLHGDEILGSEAIALLKNSPFLFFSSDFSSHSFVFVIGNLAAKRRGVRFIETDLNRSFPGGTSLEELRAAEILDELRGCDFVIDIHSTTAATSPFIIAVEETPLLRKIIDATPLSRVVHMRAGLDSSRSLIAYSPGISLEYPVTADAREVVLCIIGLLTNLALDARIEHKEYESIGVLKGSSVLDNFRKINKGVVIDGETVEEEFVPVLSGEKTYGIICIMCRERE